MVGVFVLQNTRIKMRGKTFANDDKKCGAEQENRSPQNQQYKVSRSELNKHQDTGKQKPM